MKKNIILVFLAFLGYGYVSAQMVSSKRITETPKAEQVESTVQDVEKANQASKKVAPNTSNVPAAEPVKTEKTNSGEVLQSNKRQPQAAVEKR